MGTKPDDSAEAVRLQAPGAGQEGLPVEEEHPPPVAVIACLLRDVDGDQRTAVAVGGGRNLERAVPRREVMVACGGYPPVLSGLRRRQAISRPASTSTEPAMSRIQRSAPDPADDPGARPAAPPADRPPGEASGPVCRACAAVATRSLAPGTG